MTIRRKLQGVPVSGRGRPRLMTPVDQRVTLTITGQERARVNMEARKLKPATLAGLIRSRATHTIDLLTWKEAAVKAMDDSRRHEAEKESLRRQIAQGERMVLANRINSGKSESEAVQSLRDQTDELRQKYQVLARPPQKRDSRIVGRLTTDDYEIVVHRANLLTLTVSDYLRMMLFDFVPGQSDMHMSPAARRKFYEAVTKVANDGGFGDPPSKQVLMCPNCGHKVS